MESSGTSLHHDLPENKCEKNKNEVHKETVIISKNLLSSASFNHFNNSNLKAVVIHT